MQKLKILLVSQGPFSDSYGVGKVHFDLKKEFEILGHSVDTLSSDDYYPNGQSKLNQIFGSLYTIKILEKLKKIAHLYDVIDANYECIPFSKESFGFKGVLVYRSHGMQPVYRRTETSEVYVSMLNSKKEPIKLKTRFGNIYRMLLKKPGMKEFDRSIRFADIVHCLNKEEFDFLVEYGIEKEKILLLPNGISDNFISRANKLPLEIKANNISFVGSWTQRKGINDMGQIISLIGETANIDKCRLLGGDASFEKVAQSFSLDFTNKLDVVPRYSQVDLVALLKTTKVGIFPSYIEGFGLAVVEQMACGIPVIAYNIPGPSDILTAVDPNLLIETGNKIAFAKKVSEILNMNDNDYVELVAKCKLRSQDYLMSKIALCFIDAYFKKLKEL